MLTSYQIARLDFMGRWVRVQRHEWLKSERQRQQLTTAAAAMPSAPVLAPVNIRDKDEITNAKTASMDAAKEAALQQRVLTAL